MTLSFDKKGHPLLGEPAPLRPPPLSYHIFAGSLYVLREDGTPAKIHDLVAATSPETKHRLLGPEGVREVQLQIGGFRTGAQAFTMRSNDDREVCFVTSLHYLRLNAEAGYELASGATFSGFSMVRKERVEVHVRTCDVQENRLVEHYAYTMTPGPIYLGAGAKPIFLPFEVN